MGLIVKLGKNETPIIGKQIAYAIFKDVTVEDDDKRIIQGWATTPTPDRDKDIVEPLGAEFNLPFPLLWQHRSWEPVGQVIKATPKKDGIPVQVKIFKTDTPGNLKNRLDEAWESVKIGLVRAFSIGIIPKEWSRMDGGGWHILKWDWMELSLVTIPANSEATIDSVKSIDREYLRAAMGTLQKRPVVRLR